jgi:hypothetical protein
MYRGRQSRSQVASPSSKLSAGIQRGRCASTGTIRASSDHTSLDIEAPSFSATLTHAGGIETRLAKPWK